MIYYYIIETINNVMKRSYNIMSMVEFENALTNLFVQTPTKSRPIKKRAWKLPKKTIKEREHLRLIPIMR